MRILGTGAALGAAALTVSLGLLSSPAQAAPALPAGNAPTCVTVWEKVGTITKTGYARNDCGRTLNLKIIWAHGTDGSCQTVRAGGTISSKVPRGIRSFDGADLC
ncbi:hypothetical protein [Nonomuraea pusilla]|uniref:Alpha amylase inhibitor n=1 Tax=Nonomuraea pusilla TaxID=46177 RepID=A0A1H7WSF5_9ACTN|nr:hypothetical protein [Nonomuraea pusilla]SEM24490.1 hypothetical protein SAMN05660976_04573 [Nonomuraea pusilla]